MTDGIFFFIFISISGKGPEHPSESFPISLLCPIITSIHQNLTNHVEKSSSNPPSIDQMEIPFSPRRPGDAFSTDDLDTENSQIRWTEGENSDSLLA